MELKEIKETMDKLKIGTEKSGFIYGVAGGIPLFMHKLVAEYFATEFVFDLFKRGTTGNTREKIFSLINDRNLFMPDEIMDGDNVIKTIGQFGKYYSRKLFS